MTAIDQPGAVTAAILIIGNEILSGRTRDANLPWLAERLNASGIRLMEARVIPDIPEAIVAAVNETRSRFDYVFTTGGIGPTHDDITSQCVARAFGLPLILDEEARARLQRHYPPGGLNEARLRMAHVPEGARLIDNPISAAPGFQIGNVLVLAGVPAVMQAMFEGIRHRLAGGRTMLSRAIAAYLGEGVIATDLGALQARYEDLEIGSYPFVRQGRFGASFVIRGTEAGRIAACAEELEVIIRRLGAEPITE
ncbi:MAG TPA: molybdopterin-binding protein [Alphaproteobacteria bacterium]|nr:molybdopterin-binding protein [Alphaproteobacteria bacterium]